MSQFHTSGPIGVYLLPESGSEVLIGQTDGSALIDINEISPTDTVTTDANPLGEEFIQLGSQAVVAITFQKWDREQLVRAMQRLRLDTGSVVYGSEGQSADVGLGLVGDKPSAPDGLRLKGTRMTFDFPRVVRDGRVDQQFANVGHKAQRTTVSFLALPDESGVLYTHGATS